MEKFVKREISKTIVYCPIEDAHKQSQRKQKGLIVDINANDPCFSKVFTGKKLIDVHISQMLNIF